MGLHFALVTNTTLELVWQFLTAPPPAGRPSRVAIRPSHIRRQRWQAGSGHLADGQSDSWRNGPARPFPSLRLPEDTLLIAETDAPHSCAAVRPNGDHGTFHWNSSRPLHRSLCHLRCSRAYGRGFGS